MALCSLCNSICFETLPLFPEKDYVLNLTGLQYYHRFHKLPLAQDSSWSHVNHHQGLADLHRAALQCPMCHSIRQQVDALLLERNGLDDRMKRAFPEPMFNIWLAKRPKGGQGFWVLSEESTSKNKLVVIVIAAFSFFVPKDSPLASTIRGRPLAQHLDTQTLQHLAARNAACRLCCPERKWMPAYLIDVLSNSLSNIVTIVETSQEKPANYTALSYISEITTSTTHSKDNGFLQSRSANSNDLPKMYHDAVIVTRALGIQYLWIDKICIPRESTEWSKDSERFGNVFENAYLTIAASGSERVTDGLLYRRERQHHFQVPYRTDSSNSDPVSVSTVSLLTEVSRRHLIELKDEPLSKYLWSFQERILSKRTLHFATDQIYFECLHQFSSEDGRFLKSRYHTTVGELPDGVEHFRKKALTDTPLSRWCAILYDYGQRRCANPSEKLPALANVARVFQRLLQDRYVVGHWQSTLVETMDWQGLRAKTSGDVNIPSWSTLSIDGIPSLRQRSKEALATITDIRVDLVDDTQPFSGVKAVEVDIKGPLLEARLAASDYLFFQSDDGVEHRVVANLDTNEQFGESSSTSITGGYTSFIFIIHRTVPEVCERRFCQPSATLYGLVLKAIDPAPAKWRRIGFTQIPSKSLDENQLLKYRKTITLV